MAWHTYQNIESGVPLDSTLGFMLSPAFAGFPGKIVSAPDNIALLNRLRDLGQAPDALLNLALADAGVA